MFRRGGFQDGKGAGHPAVTPMCQVRLSLESEDREVLTSLVLQGEQLGGGEERKR